MKIRFETTKCFLCLKDAEVYSGHFVWGNINISSGFCKKCSDLVHKLKADYMNRQGCRGAWHELYGIREMED